SPVARSSTAIWTACWPSGAGPRSVKVMRRPSGLKAIGGERVYAPPTEIDGLPKAGPSRKLLSPLGGPRRRLPAPPERTMKSPLSSGGSGPNGKNGAASFTSYTIVDPSGLTPSRCSGKASTESPPNAAALHDGQNPSGSATRGESNVATVIGT